MRLAALTYSAMRARSTTQQLAEIALHDVDKLPLEELDGGRHKRQRQHLGHHVGALFQAVKRHDERARAGRRGQQLERYLRQNAQRTERTFINTFSAKRTLYGVKFQKIHAAAPLNDLLAGQNGEQRVSLAGGVALKVNLLLALGGREHTRDRSRVPRARTFRPRFRAASMCRNRRAAYAPRYSKQDIPCSSPFTVFPYHVFRVFVRCVIRVFTVCIRRLRTFFASCAFFYCNLPSFVVYCLLQLF